MEIVGSHPCVWTKKPTPNHTSAIRRGPTPCVSAPKQAAGQDGLVGFLGRSLICKGNSNAILQDTHNGTGAFTYKID